MGNGGRATELLLVSCAHVTRRTHVHRSLVVRQIHSSVVARRGVADQSRTRQEGAHLQTRTLK